MGYHGRGRGELHHNRRVVGGAVPGSRSGGGGAVAEPSRRRIARHDRCARAALSVLTVKNLSIHFPSRHGEVQALDRVNLSVKPGEIVGLVGESGSGKSVLSYAISGFLDPVAHGHGGPLLWHGTAIAPNDQHSPI